MVVVSLYYDGKEAAEVLQFPGRDCRRMGAKGLWIARAWYEVGAPLLGTVCKRDLLNAIKLCRVFCDTDDARMEGGTTADLHEKLMLSR